MVEVISPAAKRIVTRSHEAATDRCRADGLGLRLHLKRPHVAHRSERESRLCKVPLDSAWYSVVRLLQPAKLLPALAK